MAKGNVTCGIAILADGDQPALWWWSSPASRRTAAQNNQLSKASASAGPASLGAYQRGCNGGSNDPICRGSEVEVRLLAAATGQLPKVAKVAIRPTFQPKFPFDRPALVMEVAHVQDWFNKRGNA
jgi:hypothetical protein